MGGPSCPPPSPMTDGSHKKPMSNRVKVLRLHMAMAKKQSEYIPQKLHMKVLITSCHSLYKLTSTGQKSDTSLKWDRWNMQIISKK